MRKLLILLMLLASVSAFAQAGRIKGKITLGKGMKLPSGAVVFISARPVGGGPPLAVARIADPKFPLELNLGQENSMMGAPLSGEVEVTVRVSQAGDPMSRTPGDLVGKRKAKVGSEDVKVVLDEKI